MLEGAEIETGDDAEVIGAAAEGDPEAFVGSGVGVDDVAGSEDDLEVDDIVADEAEPGAEERETT